MEITLRKPQRKVFEAIQKHPGSFFRLYRKSLNNQRSYYRLMTADFSPIKNYPEGMIKPFIEKDILRKVDVGVFKMRNDLVLIEKKKNA